MTIFSVSIYTIYHEYDNSIINAYFAKYIYILGKIRLAYAFVV